MPEIVIKDGKLYSDGQLVKSLTPEDGNTVSLEGILLRVRPKRTFEQEATTGEDAVFETLFGLYVAGNVINGYPPFDISQRVDISAWQSVRSKGLFSLLVRDVLASKVIDKWGLALLGMEEILAAVGMISPFTSACPRLRQGIPLGGC